MIIPSLDFINGKIVRLYQGHYQKKTYYKIDPLICLNKYLDQGAKVLHIVDLDGAINPAKCQMQLIIYLLKNIQSAIVQVGGGIRDQIYIKKLLDSGAYRVIIGSMAIKQPQIVKSWFKIFNPATLILALDVCMQTNIQYKVTINGWQKNSGMSMKQVIDYYDPLGLKYVLCTDISKDGTLLGSNIKLYTSICNKWPNIHFQASGGIGNIDDIKKLRCTKIKDIIVGRALLENKFTVMEAMQCWQKE